jgi:hypothetical protein
VFFGILRYSPLCFWDSPLFSVVFLGFSVEFLGFSVVYKYKYSTIVSEESECFFKFFGSMPMWPLLESDCWMQSSANVWIMSVTRESRQK